MVFNQSRSRGKTERNGGQIDMRKLLYRWMWKKIYMRVLCIEQKYYRKGYMEESNDCIRLENLMNYFKDEIIGESEV